jgi:hypothetical protein
MRQWFKHSRATDDQNIHCGAKPRHQAVSRASKRCREFLGSGNPVVRCSFDFFHCENQAQPLHLFSSLMTGSLQDNADEDYPKAHH